MPAPICRTPFASAADVESCAMFDPESGDGISCRRQSVVSREASDRTFPYSALPPLPGRWRAIWSRGGRRKVSLP